MWNEIGFEFGTAYIHFFARLIGMLTASKRHLPIWRTIGDPKLFLLSLGLLTWVVFFSCGSALAQGSAAQPAWSGRLHNAAGAPIAGAKIQLSSAASSASALSGDDGAFRVDAVAPGHYK